MTDHTSAPEMNDMEACMKMGLPGDEHQRLDQFVGTWKCRSRFWMEPGQDAMESEGVMINEWVLGGRFLKQDYSAMWMGQPFSGIGFWGFNNITGTYIGLWMDTMCTHFCPDEGSYDAASNTWTMLGEWDCPSGGGKMKKRSTIEVKSPTQHTMKMYMPGPDGKEFLCMELNYSKA